jgi:ATP-dependent RNA circularization protein (DNA/RNA ligase family)
MLKIKYPRSFHLPFSPGKSDDDKTIKDINCFENKKLIVTEKMDGENTTMYNHSIHARSLDSNNHLSRNWVKGLWGQISHEIPDGWRICGENLYAKHSIHYENLKSYFYVFSIWNEKNECLSIKETLEYCDLLNLHFVPILINDFTYDEKTLIKLGEECEKNNKEGFVIRNIESFHYDDFKYNLAKYVRKNHVQSDEHWINQKIIPNKLI